MYGNGYGYGAGATASLSPPSDMERMQDTNQPWDRLQLYYPEPLLPVGNRIAFQLRQRVVQFQSAAANVESVQSIQFDTPGPVYQITAAAYDNTGAALPVGLDSLDTFRVRFEHSSGDRLTTVATLGSTICGKGALPALLSRSCWHFDSGSVMRVGVTPLRANLDIDIVAWQYEARGPSNVSRG